MDTLANFIIKFPSPKKIFPNLSWNSLEPFLNQIRCNKTYSFKENSKKTNL